jgi:predicted hydrocarbon binding protein
MTTTAATVTATRPILGDYMSTECFRYLRLGAEETAGRALIVASGKNRGHSLASLLKGVDPNDAAAITTTLAEILGLEGTRLCLVNQITKTDIGYDVHITESACAAGVTADAPICAYTLGVFIGAMEVITGKRVYGQELECEAFQGNECHYKLEVLG